MHPRRIRAPGERSTIQVPPLLICQNDVSCMVGKWPPLEAKYVHLKQKSPSTLAFPDHTRDLPTATRNAHRTTDNVYPSILFPQPRSLHRSVQTPRAIVQTFATPPVRYPLPPSGLCHIQSRFSEPVVVPVHPCGRTRVGDPRTQPTTLEGGMSGYLPAQWLRHWPEDS